MSEGLYVVLGAMVGTMGTMGTTWLAARLDRTSKYPAYDKAVKELLREELNIGSVWHPLKELSRVTGMNEQDTREYLIYIQARGSRKSADMWALKSRIDPKGSE